MWPDIPRYDLKGTFISTEHLDMHLALVVLVPAIHNVPPKYSRNCLKSVFKLIVTSLGHLQCYWDVPLKTRAFRYADATLVVCP